MMGLILKFELVFVIYYSKCFYYYYMLLLHFYWVIIFICYRYIFGAYLYFPTCSTFKCRCDDFVVSSYFRPVTFLAWLVLFFPKVCWELSYRKITECSNSNVRSLKVKIAKLLTQIGNLSGSALTQLTARGNYKHHGKQINTPSWVELFGKE